jgi:hypothetical protein
MSAHFQLSEEQEQCIYHARYTLQLVSDLVDAIPDKAIVQIDPRGLSALVLRYKANCRPIRICRLSPVDVKCVGWVAIA